jgi:hypothetical protein
MNSPHVPLNGVRTDGQNSLAKHRVAQVGLLLPRQAFRAILAFNIGGLATVIAKTAFEVSPEVTLTQSAPNYWWDVQAKWRNAWWNLGGTWGDFISAVNAGKNKKPLFKNLLPRKIGEKLDQLGIGGYHSETSIGGVDPVTATTEAANAAIIIKAVGTLLIGTLGVLLDNNLKKKAFEAGQKQTAEQLSNAERRAEQAHLFALEKARKEEERKKKELEESNFLSLENLLTNADGSISQAGYGVAGVAVLAALMLGTKQKRKK